MRNLLLVVAASLVAVFAGGCTYERHNHYDDCRPRHAVAYYRAERCDVHQGYYRGGGYQRVYRDADCR